MFAPIAIKSELSFQGLPEWSHTWMSPEDFKVDLFEVMERLLVKKEHLPIGMSSEGQLAHG